MRYLLVSMTLATNVLSTAAFAAPPPKPPSFAMCDVCHKVGNGEKATLGPNLFGVGGRTSGTVPSYAYSSAMKKAGITWNRENLIAFVSDPRRTVPGTKMAFAGQKDSRAAAAIADYLLALKQ